MMKTRGFVWLGFIAVMVTAAGASALPGTFDYALGNVKVTTLVERQQAIGNEILIGATDEALRHYAPEGAVSNAVNAFLVRVDGKNILVDAGLGFRLLDNLASAGVGAGEVDVVLLTHMHRDHIGGLLRDGAAVFTNATVYVARREFEYWRQKGDAAQKIGAAYGERLRLFDPQELGTEKPEPLMGGVTAFAAYGHTPGHTVFLVEGQRGKKLLIWGDIVHAATVQTPHPEVAVTYDVDPAQAVATRWRIFESVVKNEIRYVGGAHLAYPGVAYLWRDEKEGKYHLAAADYTYTDEASGKVISVRSDGYRTETEHVKEGAARGKVKRLMETNERGSYWQTTEHTYDADGWPTRKERNLYLPGSENPVESEETVYYPQSTVAHYNREIGRDGKVAYSVFNRKWEFVATVSGDGKLTREEKAGNEACWEPLLKGENAKEALARLAKAAQDAADEEAAATDETMRKIAATGPIKRFVFPKAIEDALPADLDAALPAGLLEFIAGIRKGYFMSERGLMLLSAELTPFFKDLRPPDVTVTVVDEEGRPVSGARVTLKEIRLLSDAADIEHTKARGRRPERWEPMTKTALTDADGQAVFRETGDFSFLRLGFLLFYKGIMPEPTLNAHARAEGYEEASRDFCNIDKRTLALAKHAASVLAGVADDPEFQIEGDQSGRAKQAYVSGRLAKTIHVPEENRHDGVRVRMVLKRPAPAPEK